jgi:hypothetical protein
MTGATISQRHLTAGGQTSRQQNGCAPSSASCSRRPAGAAESNRRAPRGRADRNAWQHSCTRKSQYHLHGLRPTSRAHHAKPVKSP